jgi:hypothetical protein
MPNLTDEQRIAKINELLKEISPLNYERIFLETSLHFSKENFLKNFDEKEKEEIIKTQEKLAEINQKLQPLFTQLRQLQIRYFVEYEGEFSTGTGQTYWQTQREYLYLKTNYNIDTTTKDGWTPYTNDPTVRQLLTELFQFLLDNRFSNFKIRHIKRI